MCSVDHIILNLGFKPSRMTRKMLMSLPFQSQPYYFGRAENILIHTVVIIFFIELLLIYPSVQALKKKFLDKGKWKGRYSYTSRETICVITKQFQGHKTSVYCMSFYSVAML